jgi:phenylalanyl-tRNA synthetase beta chain
LLKAVHENSEGISDVRYFEVARTWIHQSPIIEKRQLAGVIYTRSTTTDFYTLKEYVQQLCAQVEISVTWQKPDVDTLAAWYDPYCVAQCMYKGTHVGTVGLVAQAWKDRVVQTGFLGIFELDIDFLTSVIIPIKKYTPLPKYPDIVRDVSVRISQAVVALDIQMRIQALDKRIQEVTIADFFKKPEWHDTLSLSFRYIIRDSTKTLTTQEADMISQAVEQMLTELGGEIR